MWIATAVGASVFGYLTWNRYKKNKLKTLVELNIGTVDGYYYIVDVHKRKTVVEPKEKIILTLGFVANVLESLHKAKHSEKHQILKFLSFFTRHDLTKSEINKYFRREFAFEISATLGSVKKKAIRLSLFEDSRDNLSVSYKEPFSVFKYQFLFSIASFIMLIIETLDINDRVILQKSLNYISEQYLNVKETTNAGSSSNMIKNAYAAGIEPETLRDIETG